jgi:glutamine synthetase
MRAQKLAECVDEMYTANANLETALSEAQGMTDVVSQAKAYQSKVCPAMAEVRKYADALEKMTAKSVWPFPGYEDLLFKL